MKETINDLLIFIGFVAISVCIFFMLDFIQTIIFA